MPDHPHETPHPTRKLRELEHTAEVGESDKTPWILIGDVAAVTAGAFLVLLAVAMLAYRLAA